MLQTKRHTLISLLIAAFLMLGSTSIAQAQNAQEEVSEMAVLGDILIAKPASVIFTGLGFVGYTAVLPFSVLARNEDELAEVMIKRPARSAFLRCVGCTMEQYESRRITREIETKQQSK